MIGREPEVMHLSDAFHGSLNSVPLEELAPVIHGDMDSAIVLSYQLGMVDNCRPLSHLCYVIDAPHSSPFKQLFKKAKTPIWTKLGVADQQKGQSYLLVEPCHHPPHQIVNHKAVLVLSCAVVSVKMDFSFTKGMIFKKMVEHRYNSICPLPYVEGLINEIVDLKRVNTSVIGHTL